MGLRVLCVRVTENPPLTYKNLFRFVEPKLESLEMYIRLVLAVQDGAQQSLRLVKDRLALVGPSPLLADFSPTAVALQAGFSLRYSRIVEVLKDTDTPV